MIEDMERAAKEKYSHLGCMAIEPSDLLALISDLRAALKYKEMWEETTVYEELDAWKTLAEKQAACLKAHKEWQDFAPGEGPDSNVLSLQKDVMREYDDLTKEATC